MIPCLRSVWSSVWLVEDKQGEEATRVAFESEVAMTQIAKSAQLNHELN